MAADDDTVPYIPHADFQRGLPLGRYRVVVNPELARPYVAQRTYIHVISIGVICAGAALALSGQGWAGVAVAAAGVALRRLVRHHAPRILLHLAQNQPAVYDEVTRNGVMEVRAAEN